MDWSHDLCTPDEQLTWARLSVFTGSFDLAAAEAVCAEAGVLEAVGGLVEKSVLVREDGEGKGDGNRGARYRMLTLLREYGLEKLEALGAAGETRRRLCGHFVRLAQEHERNWFGPDQPGTLAGLRAEHDNLRAVLDFCLTTPGESRAGCVWSAACGSTGSRAAPGRSCGTGGSAWPGARATARRPNWPARTGPPP